MIIKRAHDPYLRTVSHADRADLLACGRSCSAFLRRILY